MKKVQLGLTDYKKIFAAKMLKYILQVIIDCLGVGLLKSKDEIVSMHVTQVTIREIPVFQGKTIADTNEDRGADREKSETSDSELQLDFDGK